MARNDFHVITYRILAYLYDCMKEGMQPDESVISPEALGIGKSYWTDVMLMLADEGFIAGAFTDVQGHPAYRGIRSVKITRAGIEFMQENSGMQRAWKFLKGLKESIPGL